MEENIFDLLNEYFDSKIQLNLVKECKITSMQAKEGTNLEMEIARKRVCDKCFGEAGAGAIRENRCFSKQNHI